MSDQGISSTKDRFVAFAFAAAESFFETDEQGVVTYQTGIPLPAKLVPEDKLSISGHSLTDIIHKSDQPVFNVSLSRLIKKGRIGPVNVRIGGVDNRWKRIYLYGLKLPEAEGALYFAFRTARASLSIPESSMARDDGTGLLNKAAFTDIAAKALKSSKDAKITMAHFEGLAEHKETAGKEKHDELLAEISSHLQAISLEGQMATQIGDDQFAILHDSSTDQADLMDEISSVPAAKEFKTKVATIENESDVDLSEKELIKAVSYTLEKFSQEDGDISVASFGSAYKSALEETQELIKKLKFAFERQSFDMVYQPIVRLKDGKLHHYEALSRPPEMMGKKNIFELVLFIEELGMNDQFDFSVCSSAADFIAKSKKLDQFVSLAANISGATIQKPGFVDNLLKKLKGYGGMERRLALEITESSKILDLGSAAQSIDTLRKAGYKVCLDDFGAGASGYQYLRELKVDYVKIDGIYVRDMMENKENMAFVKSMVQLCKDLGIQTIAEYVETKEQAAALKEIGVDYGQGYLFGKGEAKPSYGDDANIFK